MSYSSKFLPWILVAGIVSVFGSGVNNSFLENYLFNNPLSGNSLLVDMFPDKNSLGTVSLKTPPLSINDGSSNINDNPFSLDIFVAETHSTESPTSTQKNQFPPFLFNPDIVSIGGTSVAGSLSDHIVGIDGTGGSTDSDVAGIDGTGGGTDSDVAGIDGTGGSKDKEVAGIDGTGGVIASTVSYGTVARVIRQDGNDYVVVNGIRFQITENTEIIIDGEVENDISNLRNGHIIKMKGSIEESSSDDSNNAKEDRNGVAEQIIFTTQVSGEISAVRENSITVLEQTIELHDDIIFAGTATQFSDLQVGDVVNVSGFRLSNNNLSAIRIERINSNKADKLAGAVSQLNEDDKTFMSGQLLVNYSQVIAPPVLNNGQEVNIQGTAIKDQGQTILMASSLEIREDILDDSVNRIELEGFITQFINEENFEVNGVRISTDKTTTQFSGGTSNDVGLNRKVEIEGTVDSDNQLVAEKVIFLAAEITSHKNRGRISSSTETFTWRDVGATSYRIVIGSENPMDMEDEADNKKIVFDQTFSGDVTSVEVPGLPENSAWFLFNIFTEHGPFVSRKFYRFKGSGEVSNAILTSHDPGEVLKSRSAEFTWSKAEKIREELAEVQEYRIQLHDSNYQIYYLDKRVNKPEMVEASNLPNNGAMLTLDLWTKHNGWWSASSVDLQSVKEVVNSTITSHVNNQKLASDVQTFVWQDVGADQYELRVMSRGANNTFAIHYLERFEGDTTSVTLDNLPENNTELYVRLRTYHTNPDNPEKGGWGREQYRFFGVGTDTESELTSHSNRDTLSSSTETFTWDKASNAEEYNISLANLSVDGSLVFTEDYNPLTYSDTLYNLPRNGAHILLTFSTKQKGYWVHKKYILKGTGELADAKITSHVHKEKIDPSSVTITWEDVNADGYHLKIIHALNGRATTIHKQTYGPDTLSVTLNDLPKEGGFILGLVTNHEGWWGSQIIDLYPNTAE